jgi:hypothetical protein
MSFSVRYERSFCERVGGKAELCRERIIFTARRTSQAEIHNGRRAEWCTEALSRMVLGRGCMHGWYRMVHGRMGGVEDACMDGTEWYMEGWAG